jgi:hypothetical protein
MEHIKKKTTIQGAFFGSKPKPKPAILNPPKIGGFKQIASYSVAEIIDLISDGPIEGLVDQNNFLLQSNIFKGIYLDNTPIQNTESATALPIIGALNISSLFKTISNLWISNGKLIDKGKVGWIEKTITATKTITVSRSTAGLAYSPYGGNVFNNYSGNTSEPSMPRLWSRSSNQVEFHYNPKEVFSTQLGDGVTSSANRVVNSFRTFLNNQIANGNEETKNRARLVSTDLTGFENSLNSLTSLNFSFFVIAFQGSFFETPRPSSLNISFDLGQLSSDGGIQSKIFALPQINANNEYDGIVRGVAILTIPHKIERSKSQNYYYINGGSLLNIDSATSINIREAGSLQSSGNQLYNFSNVSCQFEKGEEFQEALNGFDKVRNDFYYDSRLFGPFIKNNPIQRIDIRNSDTSFQRGLANLRLTQPIIELDGSLDSRTIGTTNNNYSDWNNDNEVRDYNSLSITHTIENPFVDKVSLSVSIGNLSDTAHTDITSVQGIAGGKLTAGAKLPTVVAIRVETGKITDGQVIDQQSFDYLIAGLSEGGCIIDFGGDYIDPKKSIEDSVRIIAGATNEGVVQENYLNKPFELPLIASDEDPTLTKRYIKIVKLSAETNSVLINKDLSLNKVTEIIEEKLSYPFSALVGVKLDASAFSSIPERSYDCRLKRIKIPNNYFPTNFDTTDKRYVKSASAYTNAVQVYIGDWNGEFTEGWTDNPAWILYDLLTSKRYGLGGYIDESQVNKWELYKIARFCDAVDDDGYFVGVSDGVGGLEPRYSCNIVFQEQTKVYDAINVVANLFRGIVFFGGSEIHFLDDRPRTPIAIFGNSNVKDGLFNYSNTRRDMQFNTVEVVYLDRFDNYKTKIEYIQDEADIRKRGVFKTTINTSGVTSRAMARRIGQHIIFQTTKENQSIDFVAGLESLLCRPGDLIIVEDEMKTRSSNYGRVLAIDTAAKTLRIDNQFSTQDFTGFITIYSPTGYSTSDDLQTIADIERSRVDEFEITGDFLNDSSNSILRGLYKFSGYSSGFIDSTTLPQQFPLYTGQSLTGSYNVFCYYNTGATGFVFSTGRAFQNDNIFDKVITNTGVFYGVDIAPQFESNSGNYTGFAYNSAASNRRGASGQVSGAIAWDNLSFPLTRGILPSEIDTYNVSQITKIALTGFDNLDYGSLIYLNQNDPNSSLITQVKQGSPYRLERKNASDQIYKIIGIRENAQNEYAMTATRYDTGKFEQIEKFITQDYLPQTFFTGVNRVGSVDVSELAIPTVTTFSAVNVTSSGFSLSGAWANVSGATGYRAEIDNKLTSERIVTTVANSPLVVTGLRSLGNWDLALIALGDGSRISSFPAKTGTFVAYTSSESNIITKPAITGFTLS